MLLNACFGKASDLESDSWSLCIRFREILLLCWTGHRFHSTFWCMDLIPVWISTLCREAVVRALADLVEYVWSLFHAVMDEWDWDLLGRMEKICRSPRRRQFAMAKGFDSGELGGQVAALRLERDWETMGWKRKWRARPQGRTQGLLGTRRERAELPALQSHCVTWNAANPYCQALRTQYEVRTLFNKALLCALSPSYDILSPLELTILHGSLMESWIFFL